MSDISRRTVIGTGAVLVFSASLGIFELPSAEARNALEARHEGRMFFRFEASFDNPVTWVSPGLVYLSGSGLATSGFSLVWQWDSRLVAASESSVTVTSGSSVKPVRARVQSAENTSRLIVELADVGPELLKKGVITLLPQVTVLPGVFDQPMTSVVPTTVEIEQGRERHLAVEERSAGRFESAPANVWAAELSVLWDGAEGGEEAATHSYPSQVLIESQGPDPIPAGAVVTVSADSVLVQDLRCAEVFIGDEQRFGVDTVTSESDGQRLCVVTLGEPVPVGTQVVLKMAAKLNSGRTVGDKVRAESMVAIEGAINSQSMQRPTGAESVALID